MDVWHMGWVLGPPPSNLRKFQPNPGTSTYKDERIPFINRYLRAWGMFKGPVVGSGK